MKGRWWGAVAVVLCLVRLTACTPSQQPYEIAVFGDVPYSSSAATKYERMIDDINAGTTNFSVHVGDIGPGTSSTCTNATVDTETARFDTFTRPLVYTPGDNEWTDCGSAGCAARLHPQHRLPGQRHQVPGTDDDDARVAGLVGISGERPVAPGTRHLRHPPHGRRQGQLQATGSTIPAGPPRSPGSGRPSPRPRLGDKGVVLLAQVDPKFSDPTPPSTAPCTRRCARRSNFGGQVLFVHGDGHDYISDRPLAASPTCAGSRWRATAR